jgi:hypothetical protein
MSSCKKIRTIVDFLGVGIITADTGMAEKANGTADRRTAFLFSPGFGRTLENIPQ